MNRINEDNFLTLISAQIALLRKYGKILEAEEYSRKAENLPIGAVEQDVSKLLVTYALLSQALAHELDGLATPQEIRDLPFRDIPRTLN